MKYIKTFEDFTSKLNEDSHDVLNPEEKEKGPEHVNYMFFQNLKEIKSNIDKILSMDYNKVDEILSNGHDWAADHIATSKDDIDEVTHFLKIHIEESEITDKDEHSPE